MRRCMNVIVVRIKVQMISPSFFNLQKHSQHMFSIEFYVIHTLNGSALMKPSAFSNNITQ